jgi:hypothetical protein
MKGVITAGEESKRLPAQTETNRERVQTERERQLDKWKCSN